MNLVSIVVPIYNETDNLRICIDSLLAQNYPRLEIILVDDGSEDASLSVSREYASHHVNIRLLELSNGGVSRARNVGMDSATGEYITFVDSDDVVTPEYVSNLVEAIQMPGVALAADRHTLYGSEPSFSHEADGTALLKSEEAALRFAGNVGWYCWGKLYRRALLTSNSIRFNEHIAVCEDLLFNLEVLQHCEMVALTPSIDYMYRQTAASATNDLSNRRWFDVLEVYEIALSLASHNEPLLAALSFNCELMLCEAKYRLRRVPCEERKPITETMRRIEVGLPKRKDYSLRQKIKLGAFQMSPGIVMKIRRRKIAK